MKVNAGRKVGTVLLVVLLGVLTGAQAGGAKDYGQRGVTQPDNLVQPLAGPKDFGQRGVIQPDGGAKEFGDR
ncbi:hypothetical protein DAERI_070014 [Deinococcus aerius]|uniref:Uncharacterized protein n=1 Tax=Deinococcus aerius TaxID=200253 RepID=A0A2I9D5T2_9DEIO|nr:hypothetical protein DAERI_070014 [Deinococcus aerius]